MAAIVPFFFLLGQASQQFVEPPADPAIYPTCGTTFQSRVKKVVVAERKSTTPLLPPPNPMRFLPSAGGHLSRCPVESDVFSGHVVCVCLLTAARLLNSVGGLPSRRPYPTSERYANDRQASHLAAVLREFIRAGVSSLVLELSISNFLGVAQDGGNNAHANTILCACLFRFLRSTYTSKCLAP